MQVFEEMIGLRLDETALVKVQAEIEKPASPCDGQLGFPEEQ